MPHVATRRGKVPGSGGKKRSAGEVQALTDKITPLWDYGASLHAIAKQVGIPVDTVKDYVARIRAWRKENPIPGRDEARRAQYERLMGQNRTLQSQGKHSEVEKRERQIARILGTEAPRTFELSAPGGGPIAVKAGPDLADAFRRMVEKTQG